MANYRKGKGMAQGINKADTPVIKTFFCDNNAYLYDFGKNDLLRVTKEQLNEIKELEKAGLACYMEMDKDSQPYRDIRSLAECGYFSCTTVEEIEHPHSGLLPYLLGRMLQDVVLQVTQDCNFQCRYCLFASDSKIERSHAHEIMDFETAKKAIDYLFHHCMDTNEITIGFYGGEPFLNFGLVKQVTEYAKSLFCSKRIRFLTTTNASVLNDEMIDFIIANRFELSISMDGTPDYQNNHRKFRHDGSGSFNAVIKTVNRIKEKDIDYFKKYVIFVPVIFNDEDEGLVYSYFNSIGVPRENVSLHRANLNGIDYMDSSRQLVNPPGDDAGIAESEEYAAFKKKLNNREKVPAKWHPDGQCVPGVRRIFVTTSGDMMPCEKIVESEAFVIGNVHAGEMDYNKALDFLNVARLTGEECRKCWAFRFCETCISHCLDPDEKCLSKEQKCIHCANQKNKALKYLKYYVTHEIKDTNVIL